MRVVALMKTPIESTSRLDMTPSTTSLRADEAIILDDDGR